MRIYVYPNIPYDILIKNEKNVSSCCEIEDFVEAHLFKLRGIWREILRSRILRVLCNSSRMLLLIEGKNLTAAYFEPFSGFNARNIRLVYVIKLEA